MNRRRPISTLLRITLLALSAPATLAAQNLIGNPEFDGFSSNAFPGWTTTSVLPRAGEDADACPNSDSFLIQSNGTHVFVMANDCVEVETNDLLYLELTYRSDVEVYVRVAEFTNTTCGPALISTLGTPLPASADWTTARVTKEITFASTRSVKFQPVTEEDVAPYEAEFDRAYLGFTERVFADDFDGGSFCRWDEILGGDPL